MRRLVARYYNEEGHAAHMGGVYGVRRCMIGEIDSEYEDEEYGTMYRVRLLTEEECSGLEPGDAQMVYGDPARQAKGRQYWHPHGCAEIFPYKSEEELELIRWLRKGDSPVSMRDHHSILGLKHGEISTYLTPFSEHNPLKRELRIILETSYDPSTGMLGIGIGHSIDWALLSDLVGWFREYVDCEYSGQTEPGDIEIYAHNEGFWVDIQIYGGDQ